MIKIKASIFLVAITLLVGCASSSVRVHQAADAVPRNEPRSASGNPVSYVVRGKRYFVMQTSKDYKEKGVASWYGKKFHGRRTSSGERYNMYAMTAAHKTLPLPTYVRVTNLNNKRSIVVKVNDRGPFIKSRIIDLSYTAAQKLDMLNDGTALVEVVALSAEASNDSVSNQTASGSKTAAGLSNDLAAAPVDWRDQSHLRNRIYIQVGAFSDRNNAEAMFNQLLSAQFADVQIVDFDEEQGMLHRVRIGPLHTVAATDQAVGRLENMGVGDYQVVIE